jgi:phosphoribosyl-dephospho-CoA transferase
MEKRTGYRDMIQSRKEKEKALLDLLAQDKVDLVTLTAAIEAAKANLVAQRFIDRAIKTQDWLKYCKEVEGLLQAAIQEKVKENLAAVIERIE